MDIHVPAEWVFWAAVAVAVVLVINPKLGAARLLLAAALFGYAASLIGEGWQLGLFIVAGLCVLGFFDALGKPKS